MLASTGPAPSPSPRRGRPQWYHGHGSTVTSAPRRGLIGSYIGVHWQYSVSDSDSGCEHPWTQLRRSVSAQGHTTARIMSLPAPPADPGPATQVAPALPKRPTGHWQSGGTERSGPGIPRRSPAAAGRRDRIPLITGAANLKQSSLHAHRIACWTPCGALDPLPQWWAAAGLGDGAS